MTSGIRTGTTRSIQLAEEIRRLALTLIRDGGSGHPGGSLSMTDILAVLFAHHGEGRRRRVLLSKGHGAPALYAAMMLTGVIQADPRGLRRLGSALQGHPDRRFCPELEISSGSLGQGASIAVGLAHSVRRRSSTDEIVTILGDGELQEGQVWEAAMAATHFGLSNLVWVIDANGIQHDGMVNDVMSLGSPVRIADRFTAFGWTASVVDGHDHDVLEAALLFAPTTSGPRCVVAETVKGKGVPFMEGEPAWHSLASPEMLADHLGQGNTNA